MVERPRNGDRVVLVHLDLPDDKDQEDLAEFESLCHAAGGVPVATCVAARPSPDAKYFVGSGKAGEIAECVQREQADLVIFNHALSPSQERNLEGLVKCRVLDRTGLILDIFAQRARSFEGKLQVELAQMRYLSTRLVRAWTHLERQKGGIGLRGPGETQLETDRRLIGVRIKRLNERLEKVRRQRHQGRRARTRAELPAVSLVGYTNAGKSSLFNRLTGAEVYAADRLFATLDTTLRRLEFADTGPVVLADTVGFIRHLPHDLVAAFRSTLEETREADLLLHVVDAGAERRDEQREEVQRVLAEIGADDVPQLEVYNKIDIAGAPPRLERNADGRPTRVWVSAATGAGVDLLETALVELLHTQQLQGWAHLPAESGRIRARLYTLRAVEVEQADDAGGWWLRLRISRRDLDQLQSREGVIGSLLAEEPGEFLAGAVQAP